jgi:hypothetical protein
MHINVVLNHISKKVVNKLSFNLISFKMQKFITNFHCYNYFQWKMVPYFQLISCLELFPSIPNVYSKWPIDLFSFNDTLSCVWLHCVFLALSSVPILPLCFIKESMGQLDLQKIRNGLGFINVPFSN